MLLYTSSCTGADQDGICNYEVDSDDNSVMDNVDYSKSVYRVEKDSMYELLADKESEDLEEAWKEWM